jgi:hypothetical protein
MGVKSTKDLTRQQAEAMFVELKLPEAKRQLRSEVALLDDKQLEDVLEKLNDKANDGEGFENYIIKSE